MTTYVFPGQGAQKRGMGKDLFQAYPDLINQANDILGYDLTTLCLEDPNKELNLTQFTQPALYTVSALTYLQKIDAGEERPQFTAGHSLGEYVALFAAGAYDFATGLKIVKKRGQLMGDAGLGGMAAVMNLQLHQIKDIIQQHQFQDLDIANFNAPSQIVISGPADRIEAATAPFEEAGARYVIIKVKSAFHSRYMEEARLEFERYLKSFQFSPLQIPVIANVTARPYASEAEIPAMLSEQITSQVNWVDTIRYLWGLGQETFVECGPGKVLTGLIRRIRKESEPLVEATAPQQASPNKQVVTITPSAASFCELHKLDHPYMAGSLDHGISSVEMVSDLAKAGLMGSFGAVGLNATQQRTALAQLRQACGQKSYAVALKANINQPHLEMETVQRYLDYGVSCIEATGYLQVTPGLVYFRLKGATRNASGSAFAPNRIIGRATRPEVAAHFLAPPPINIVQNLVSQGLLSPQEAELAPQLPLAQDLIAVADCGGPTDQANPYTLLPSLSRQRDRAVAEHGYTMPLHIGAAGGIGTPEAVAAARLLGADFIVTGSINQATKQAQTSPLVKDMLVSMNVQDTTYAPAWDMFEMGARMQVFKRGIFFPARANKLYSLYQQYSSLQDIDEKNRTQLESKYFGKNLEQVWENLQKELPAQDIEKANRNSKYRMLCVFKEYYRLGMQSAITGDTQRKVDVLVYCGSSLGAFNQYVAETPLAGNWQNRCVAQIGLDLMTANTI